MQNESREVKKMLAMSKNQLRLATSNDALDILKFNRAVGMFDEDLNPTISVIDVHPTYEMIMQIKDNFEFERPCKDYRYNLIPKDSIIKLNRAGYDIVTCLYDTYEDEYDKINIKLRLIVCNMDGYDFINTSFDRDDIPDELFVEEIDEFIQSKEREKADHLMDRLVKSRDYTHEYNRMTASEQAKCVVETPKQPNRIIDDLISTIHFLPRSDMKDYLANAILSYHKEHALDSEDIAVDFLIKLVNAPVKADLIQQDEYTVDYSALSRAYKSSDLATLLKVAEKGKFYMIINTLRHMAMYDTHNSNPGDGSYESELCTAARSVLTWLVTDGLPLEILNQGSGAEVAYNKLVVEQIKLKS